MSVQASKRVSVQEKTPRTARVGVLLSRLAETRLSAALQPPQRYGLSVFLRKGYPAVGRRHAAVGSRGTKLRVRGAAVERAMWDDVPADVGEIVRRRVADDTLAAAHVLRAHNVQVARVSGEKSLVLEYLVAPGIFTTLLVEVAPCAELVIQESLKSAIMNNSTSAKPEGVGETYYASALVILRVGEGARVRWFGRSVGAPGFTVVERLAVLAQDAVLEYRAALVAANAIRDNLHVVLDGPGATARVKTLFAGAADHQLDLGVTAEHRAPHTVSDLRAKGVLAGKAQAVYRGLIRVEREARGSDGYQRCDTLLLSPTAEVDPVPNLEINTNDVRCTHGVTTGHVNPEHLFYLQSRGFSAETARQLLVEGFVGSVLQHYPDAARAAVVASMQQTLAEPA